MPPDMNLQNGFWIIAIKEPKKLGRIEFTNWCALWGIDSQKKEILYFLSAALLNLSRVQPDYIKPTQEGGCEKLHRIPWVMRKIYVDIHVILTSGGGYTCE